jgi:hypothetical protein
MSHQNAVDTLNELLGAEFASLIPRLGEAAPRVTWPATEDQALLRRVLADAQTHQRELTQLILKLRGSPNPPRYAAETGGVHYVKLSYLMPEVIESMRRLIAAYETAGPTGSVEADALIARHLAEYQRHLAGLERLHTGGAAATPS